jgi:hypothetical protein
MIYTKRILIGILFILLLVPCILVDIIRMPYFYVTTGEDYTRVYQPLVFAIYDWMIGKGFNWKNL